MHRIIVPQPPPAPAQPPAYARDLNLVVEETAVHFPVDLNRRVMLPRRVRNLLPSFPESPPTHRFNNGRILAKRLVNLQIPRRRPPARDLSAQNHHYRFENLAWSMPAVIADPHHPAVALAPDCMGKSYIRIKSGINLRVPEYGKRRLKR